MDQLTHNQEYTVDMQCGEEYQGKNIYKCGAHFDACCLGWSKYQTREKVSVAAQLTVLRKQESSKNAHVMSQNLS
jgi:hypothetical protein